MDLNKFYISIIIYILLCALQTEAISNYNATVAYDWYYFY